MTRSRKYFRCGFTALFIFS